MTEFMFIPAYYEKEIILSNEVLETLAPHKTVALFASVQFIKLDAAIAQLKKNGNDVLTTHGKRTSGAFQLLGCDCFADSFAPPEIFEKCDAVVYVGDGLFHPHALLLAARGKKKVLPLILFDPISQTTKIIGPDTLKRNHAKYKANLMKYLCAQKIGALVSTKTGQQYLHNALLLKTQLEKQGKQCFIFVEDTFYFQNMENYPFIEVWVNTACPRIGFDDVLHLTRPLININDALAPQAALKRYD